MHDEGLFVGGVLMAVIMAGYIFFTGFYNGQRVAMIAPPLTQPAAVAASTTNVAITSLARGERSTVKERKNYVILSKTELTELWKMLDVKTPAPNVDFSQSAVLAVFAGERPTAGYTIAVTKIEDAALRTVTVTTTSPDSTCVLAQSLTSPYQIVTVPKTALDLTHTNVAAKKSCLY